jgi:hypothetical protein
MLDILAITSGRPTGTQFNKLQALLAQRQPGRYNCNKRKIDKKIIILYKV